MNIHDQLEAAAYEKSEGALLAEEKASRVLAEHAFGARSQRVILPTLIFSIGFMTAVGGSTMALLIVPFVAQLAMSIFSQYALAGQRRRWIAGEQVSQLSTYAVMCAFVPVALYIALGVAVSAPLAGGAHTYGVGPHVPLGALLIVYFSAQFVRALATSTSKREATLREQMPSGN